MFKFFKRGKGSEDPLTDLSTVSRWMQQLPAGDIYTAQEQVVQSLIQFNHAQLPMSKDRLAVLTHLDEQARDMQYSLCVQYLRNPRMSKVIESRLWTAIHAFYWEVTRGYHAFLMDFVSNPGGSRIQASVPLITARAIRGFADIFKWRHFRYEKIEEKLWLRLHNLFRVAEFDGFQGASLKLYSNETQPTSCVTEYVHALLLSPLGAGSLTPRQLEMVDQWLDSWAGLAELQTTYSADRHHLGVDTAKGQGLHRLRGQTEVTCRYVVSDRLLEHMQSVTRSLKAGATPASLGLGEEFRLPDGYDLLEYVIDEWSPVSERDRRRAPREREQGRWEVIRELPNICLRIQADLELASGSISRQGLTPEEILDIKLYGFVTERTKATLQQRTLSSGTSHAAELWPVQDRSETGVGILLRNEDSDWIKVGKLLALRADPGEPLKLGIIRRITRIDNDWRKIGIHVIAEDPRLARMEPGLSTSLSYSVDDSDLSPSGLSSSALILAVEGSELLLMESAKYAHGKTVRLKEGNEQQTIRLETVKDKGDGWLMTTFTALAA